MERRSKSICMAWLVAAVLLGGMSFSFAQAEEPPALVPEDLTQVSLEDLMNIEITNVLGYRQSIQAAPAAIYVITQEDIRRSGLEFIPEILRMAPGLEVARFDSSSWSISSRGFNQTGADKLLVMMDGRTLYLPNFGGVYWDAQDYVLADIDRIDVIRGPGATYWGANAVNGVINITTKSARDTQGGLVSGNLATDSRIGSFRYGDKIDSKTYYRVYGKYRDIDDSRFSSGEEAADGWDSQQAGFRIDRYASDTDVWTLQGDIIHVLGGHTISMPQLAPAGNVLVDDQHRSDDGSLLGRWTHDEGAEGDWTAQLYYSRAEIADTRSSNTSDLVDLSFQNRSRTGRRNEVIWGGEIRLLQDDVVGSETQRFNDQYRNDYVFSGFVQDRWTIVPDRLALFIGSKFEVNNITGFEIQPSARILWTPDPRQSVWGAVSRAVRTPTRIELTSREVLTRMPTAFGPPISADLMPNEDFKSEQLLAFELGYRYQPASHLSLDVVAFYNTYRSLRSLALGPITTERIPKPTHLVQPLLWGNDASAETFGGEIAATWNVKSNWRLMASYSLLFMQVYNRADNPAPVLEETYEGSSPRNQFQIRSYYDITRNLEFNALLYYVDNVPAYNVPAYIRVDANIVWRPKPNLEWSVGVRNLFDNIHPEFDSPLNDAATEMQRQFYTQLVWRF